MTPDNLIQVLDEAASVVNAASPEMIKVGDSMFLQGLNQQFESVVDRPSPLQLAAAKAFWDKVVGQARVLPVGGSNLSVFINGRVSIAGRLD